MLEATPLQGVMRNETVSSAARRSKAEEVKNASLNVEQLST
jgi:hypothetical protein